MKTLKLSILSLALAGISLTACKNDKKPVSEAQAVETTTDGNAHLIDTAQSTVEWRGYKILKSEHTSHYGTIKFESGEVTVFDGKLESGKFVANMNSLSSQDLNDQPEKKQKLDSHLKDGDFFEVAKFPTATYEITKVLPQTDGNFNTKMEGNLTIKGITKPVSFDANVAVEGDQISIKTKPQDINRKDFGVNFVAPAQNGVIKDEVTLQVNIVANLKK